MMDHGNSNSDAAEFRNLRERKSRGNLGRVVLEIEGDPAAVLKAEAEINKNLRACGCKTAALFLSFGLITVAVSFLLPAHYGLTALRTPLGVCAFLAAVTVTGKVIGILVAERKLRTTIDSFAHSRALRHAVSHHAVNSHRRQQALSRKFERTKTETADATIPKVPNFLK